MLRRSPFPRKPPAPSKARVRQWEGGPVTPRAPALRMADTRARLVVPLVKQGSLQSGPYMAAVRSLACDRCGYSAKRSQFCHRDEGKGGMLKTDCREGWPGCGPHDGEPGCHWFVGTSGRMTKAERRAFELGAGARTRRKVGALGLWPARLPRWTK